MKSPLRTSIVFVALGLLAAACSSSNAAETTTSTTTTTQPTTTTSTTTTSTTQPPSTTTSTEPPIGIAATINGLPGETPQTEQRRVVAVKIDNHPKARPQSGIETADAVYELIVEAGVTRFIALFHQSDSEYVGPNRSGRPTDATIVKPLDAPFEISGAQPWVQSIFREEGIKVIYETRDTSFRIDERSRPQNLYVSTPSIRDFSDSRGWSDDPPPPLFVFGTEPTPGEEATVVTMHWSGSPPVVWVWDGEVYRRFNDTVPHEFITEAGMTEADVGDDEATIGQLTTGQPSTGQLTAQTLVVLKARRYVASPPGQGSSVPALETVGDGEAFVFHSGQVITGTWERGSDDALMRIFTADGDEIVLPPGKLWISIFPRNRDLTWE